MKIELNINLKDDWLRPVTYRVNGQDVCIATYPGVFSYGKVDKATDFLLRSISFNPKDKVLDLGCGSGVIGIVAAKSCPQGEVECVDIDPRAVALTNRNIASSKLKNIKAYGSQNYDSVSAHDFTKIIINLPAQVAKPVQQEMLKRSIDYLAPQGELFVVVQARLQRFVKRELKEAFGNVDFEGKESHFVILKSHKNT